jgi:hypothetical protein
MKKSYILFLILTILSSNTFTQEEQPQQPISAKKRSHRIAKKEAGLVPQAAVQPATPEQPAVSPEQPTAPSAQTAEPTSTNQPSTPTPTEAESKPAAAPTPPVEFEQKTWEKSEAVELEKEESTHLVKNESTEKIVKLAQEINQNVQTIVNQILKKREDAYSKYALIDGQLDKFLQEISILEGQYQSKISQAEEQEKTTTDPNKKIDLELYKKDWIQLKADVEKADEAENKLIQELKKIDEKVDEGLDFSIKAKKINLDVLKSSNEQDAQTKLNQIKEIQEKCTSLQNSLSVDFFNNIDSLSTQIQNAIQTLQVKTKKLEDMAKELKLLEEPTTSEVKINSQATPEPQTKPAAEKPRYIYTKTVAATAWFINFLNKIKNWFKELIFGKSVEQKQDSVTAAKIAPNADIQNKEEKTPTPEEAKAKISQQTQYQNLQGNSQQTEILQQEPQETKPAVTEKSEWRQNVEYVFSKFLDGITWFIEKTKYYSKKLYDTYAKEKMTAFVSDVHSRIGELENEGKVESKTPEEPVAAQSKN